MYEAINLSQYIVSKCVDDNCPISNLQLQKILYYIQKTFLQQKNSAAFSDEIEAWQFGPVVPNVYYHYCGYGAMPILLSHENYNIKSEDEAIINPIVEEKRKLNPWTMVEETHKENGAWAQTYEKGKHNVIPLELIKAVG